MFIAHGEKFRKNARWIMAAVLLLLIPGFVALFTTTSSSQRREGELPTIGGRPVNTAEFRAARDAVIQSLILSSGREVRRTPEMEDRITQQAMVNLLMLRKANELGIHVTDEEVIQAVQHQPILLNETGQFDPERYRRFTSFLYQLGISEARYEQLIRDQIARMRLEHLITAGVVATPHEVEMIYTPLHERVTIDMVEFNLADYTQPVTVSNEEAQVFYEQNKETYRTPAQVKVRYAQFNVEDFKKTIKLTDEEITEFYERHKPRLTGTNSVAPTLDAVKSEVESELLATRADRAAADRATEFSIHLVARPGEPRPDFVAACKEFGVQPVESNFFSNQDRPLGATGSVAFVQQAFALTPEAPTSDPVPGPDGYYVLEYLDSKPSVIPPFEEVKDIVVDQIKRMHAYDATVKHGQEIAAELKKLAAAGKSFADACAELKLKAETPPPFSAADEKLNLPVAQRIQNDSLGMKIGAISEFIPTATGGIIFHLKDRQPPDPATAKTDRAQWEQRVLQQNRQAFFQTWMGNLIREQQVDFGRMRSRPTEPELPEPAS